MFYVQLFNFLLSFKLLNVCQKQLYSQFDKYIKCVCDKVDWFHCTSFIRILKISFDF